MLFICSGKHIVSNRSVIFMNEIMNEQQVFEMVRGFAHGISAERLSKVWGLELELIEQVIQEHKEDIATPVTVSATPITTSLGIGETNATAHSVKISGIDLSVWDDTPDFSKVKAEGIEFIIARAGYGKGNIDPQFKRTASECNRLGIPLGAYWFSYACNADMAAREAQYCLDVVKPYRLEYPIFFDLEYDTIRYARKQGVSIGKSLATSMVKAFCSTIEKARYYAANYSNTDFADNMFDMDSLSQYDLWYACYNRTPSRDDACVWQYSESGKVNGISSDTVDMDYSFIDYPSIIKKAGLNRL